MASRLTDLNSAKIARRVARHQGIAPPVLSSSSSRTTANQVGTLYNLPCAAITTPGGQDEDGNFYTTPGWSEEGGGDIAPATADTTRLTADSTVGTADMTISTTA